MTNKERIQIAALVGRLKGRAKYAFTNAAVEQDPTARRFINHGATCYANSALEVEKFLNSHEPSRR